MPHFTNVSNRKYLIPGFVILIFAVTGVIVLLTSRAATPYASFEAESGSPSSGASVVSDNNSSGGKYIQFGNQTSTSPSGSCGSSTSGSPLTPQSGMSSITDYTSLAKDYEFNGTSLPANWSTGIYNYGNVATQFATPQVKFNGSAAELVAQQAGTNGASSSSQGLPYVSGEITTAGNYQLNSGRIDFCAQMPAGQGLWSGLWLAGGTRPTAGGGYTNSASTYGEIDVQEMLLANTTTVYGSAHGWNSSTNQQLGSGETQQASLTSSAATGFHEYSLVWQPSLLTWAIDGQAYAQYSMSNDSATGGWPFQNLYLIVDLVVGGSSSWGGAPNSATTAALASTSPPMIQVKWIKVWQ